MSSVHVSLSSSDADNVHMDHQQSDSDDDESRLQKEQEQEEDEEESNYYDSYYDGEERDSCGGRRAVNKRHCEELGDQDVQFQQNICKIQDGCSDKMIAFLSSFACASISFLSNYDSRRVSMSKILREAREKDLHYERMDACDPAAYNPNKLCIDLSGPQHWYLNKRHPYQERTMLELALLNAGTRIALAALDRYDSCRQLVDVIVDAADKTERHYETMDSPIPHDPSCPVVHDFATHLHLMGRLPAPRSPAHNIAAAGLAHYDSRRVSLSKAMHHVKQAEARYDYADFASAYADILTRQPACDVMGTLNQFFSLHESTLGRSIDMMELQTSMPCLISARLARQHKDMIARQAATNKTNKKLAEEAQLWRNIAENNISSVCAYRAKKKQEMLFDLQEAQLQRNIAENKICSLEQEIASLQQWQQQKLFLEKTAWCGAVQGVHWQYNDGRNWYSFDSDANQKLHRAYIDHQNGGSGTTMVTSCGTLREIRFDQFVQINPTTGARRQIRLKLDSPPTWTTPPHQLLCQTTYTRPMYVDEQDNAVWKIIHQLFSTTGHACSSVASRCSVMANVNIKAIYRIEHFALWRKYRHRVHTMLEEKERLNVNAGKIQPHSGSIGWVLGSAGHALDKHGALVSDINEEWLFHGTTYNNADSIVRSGFDFRTCHRGMYGAGVYFASESCKSNQYTCARHTGSTAGCTCKCERTMIVARVALGEPYYATSTLPNQRRPPERCSGHGVYDSIIANPGSMKGHANGWQTHQEFVIFNMEQAYPSFVVQYTIS